MVEPREDDARMHRVNSVHATLLAQWRKAMDLVGPGPLEPHLADASGAVAGLPAAGRWVDLGSGAGFPGVALAGRYPHLRVELVESRQKRATFLEKVVRESQLDNAIVRCMRSEALDAGAYDGLISRAYKAPEAVLAEDGAHLLRPGGYAVLLLGDGPPPPAPAGWVLIEGLRYAVPDGHRRRLVLQKQPVP